MCQRSVDSRKIQWVARTACHALRAALMRCLIPFHVLCTDGLVRACCHEAIWESNPTTKRAENCFTAHADGEIPHDFQTEDAVCVWTICVRETDCDLSKKQRRPAGFCNEDAVHGVPCFERRAGPVRRWCRAARKKSTLSPSTSSGLHSRCASRLRLEDFS